MLHSYRLTALSLGFSSFLLGSVSLIAVSQAAEPPAPAEQKTAAQSDDGKVEEVVVTAQRRKQSAQDVGIGLTVLSGDALVNNDVKTVNDISKLVPSFQVTPAFGSGQPEFRMRGMGFSDYASNNSPSVGVYVDDVPYPYPIMTQGLLYDIGQVEVLRGPQGTLYGRNTTAGAVKFQTNNPTDTLTAGITSEYTSHNELKSEGFVSGPVSNRLQLRLSAAEDEGGAWQKNRETGQSIGDADRKAVRLKSNLDVNDDLNIALNLHLDRDQSENAPGYLLNPSGTSVPSDSKNKYTGWGGLSAAFSSQTGLSPNQKPGKDNTGQGIDLTAEQNLGAVKLTNIAAYEGMERREYNDWSATSLEDANTLFVDRTRVLSDELRLSSNQPARFQWVTGLFYSNEHLNDRFDSDFLHIYGITTKTSYVQNTQTVSEFGQADYALTDRLKVIGGLRQENEDRKLENFTTSISGGASTLANYSTGYSKVSGKVGAEYRVVDPALLYGTISRGVKSGGFTTYNSPSPTAEATPFGPEKALTYETGVKTDLLDKTLRINAATFYTDYRDQQVQSVFVDPVYGAIGHIVNAPKSHIYGGELEVEANPIKSVKISQGLGYARGQYDEYSAVSSWAQNAGVWSATTSNLKGRDLGNPKTTYHGSLSYTWKDDLLQITPEFDYSFRGKQTSPLGGLYDIDQYWLFNAGVTFAPVDGPWSVTLFARNILGQKYDLERNFFTNANVGYPGEPTTVGLRFKYTY